MRVVVLALLGACADPAPPPGPEPAVGPAPGPTGELVFVAESAGRVDAHRIDAAGGASRPVAEGGVYPAAPDPTGRHILSVDVEDGPGGHVERLTLRPRAGGAPLALPVRAEFVRNPVWTPDGGAIVVESSAHSFRDLYRVPLDGTPVERLTDAPGGSFDPSVAPDGTLLYASSRDGELELYRQPLGGGAAVRLTHAVGDDRRPSFRPDGQRFAWLASRSGRTEVWTAAADGSDALPLRPAGAGEDLDLAWSPDGTVVAVVEGHGPERIDLVLVDAVRGRELARLDGGVNEQPAWSPDGAWVAFSSTRGGDRELWCVARDGTGLRQLSARSGADWLPRWLHPDGDAMRGGPAEPER